jgi:hypothetical protein
MSSSSTLKSNATCPKEGHDPEDDTALVTKLARASQPVVVEHWLEVSVLVVVPSWSMPKLISSEHNEAVIVLVQLGPEDEWDSM